jgi:DMSO reductase anchor subunit
LHAVVALALGLLALAASTLHLGRPLYAFRAFLGLRTSWMSREIVVLGGFAGAAALYAAVSWFFPRFETLQTLLGMGVALSGLLGVFCSALIYHDTQREFWNISLTGVKFALTMLVLGLPLVLLTSLAASLRGGLDFGDMMSGWGQALVVTAVVATALKMLFEATIFTHLRSLRRTPLQRTAALMAGPLKAATRRRFVLGLLGGVALPLAFVAAFGGAEQPSPPSQAWVLASFILLVLVAAELHERFLFFTAVVSPRMPGAAL